MKKQIESSGLYKKIWNIVNQIPEGKVATYGQITRLAGIGQNARLVGYALHKLPEGSSVPWHRVINASGKISLRTGKGYHDIQKMLLEKEGIIFRNDKIDLEKYGWYLLKNAENC